MDLKEKKKKTHSNAVYKRLISALRRHKAWKWNDRKRLHVNGNLKKARVTILFRKKKLR